MEQDNWQRIKSIVNSALELDLKMRAEFVDSECAGNDYLRARVNELLFSYDTDFLESNDGNSSLTETNVLRPGESIGRYEVVRLLGVGGMGEVYLARDESLDRLVCIKVFSKRTSVNRTFLERLVREARTASARNHPHICTIYEINKEHDPPFISMEYVEGRTLAEMIASGELQAQTAIDLALQIADGLEDAHDAGIVHRDIKPANIMVNKRGAAKILDFGLAKRINADLEGKTQEQLSISGMIMGTVSYMSPEQVKGEKIDIRSDIFSFGVVLYEMLTRRRPFAGDSTAETMALILTAEPAPLCSNSTHQIQTLVNKCLEKDRTRRFQSMNDVIYELRAIDPKHLNGFVTANQEPPTIRMQAVRSERDATRSLYLRGKVKAASENREDVESAILLLEDAVKLDPNFPEAYATLAQAYTTKAFNFASDTEKKQINENAEVAVEAALMLDPNLAEGHFARGVIIWTLAKRFPHEQAIQAYKRAIELDPNLSEAHHRLGLVYFHVGLLDQAREEIKRALEINPNNTMARFRLGTVDAHQGKFEDAVAVFKTIPRDVSPSIVDRAMADALVNLGRLEEADALVEDYLERYPHDEGGNVTSVKAVLLAKTGKRAEAEAMIRHAIEIGRGFGHFHHTSVNIAAAYALLNEPDEAAKWLRDAADNGFPCYPYFEVNPNFDSIRNSVGFSTVLSEIKRAWERRLDELFPVQQTTSGLGAKRSASQVDTVRLLPSGRKIAAVAVVLLLITGLAIVGWLKFGRPSSARIDSLAVMPLLNQTGDPDSDYLSDGITETLIGRLSQIPDLSVMARSTVFRYKGKDIAARDIGKELQVPAILTGRVSRRGDQFNLYVELIDADTEKLIWYAEYNRPGSSLATIPGEIARDVANHLRQKLTGAEEQKITRNYTENSAAYELYLKGRYYWDKRNEESYRVADNAYKQAIAIDPNYALAYAGLADLYLFRDKDLGRNVAMPLAKQYALKALEIDETLAEAHNTLAFVNENYDFDRPAAEAGFKRAIELKSAYAVAHQFYGGFLMQTGHPEEGLAEAKRAVELEPYSAAMNWFLGMQLGYARLYDEAIAQQQKTLQLQPGFALSEGNLAGLYVLTGKYDSAMALIQKGLRSEEQGDRSLQGIVYVKTGREKDARNILSEMVDRCNRPCGNTVYGVARIYAALGEKDEAVWWLNIGYDRRIFNMFFLRVDPFFDPLHGDPRYEELIRRIGLQS